MVWFQKIFIPPRRKGSDFPGGRGVNLPNFQGGGGVHHREIFPVGSRGANESNKKTKTQKFTTTIIYLRKYKTRASNDLLESRLKTPRLMN